MERQCYGYEETVNVSSIKDVVGVHSFIHFLLFLLQFLSLSLTLSRSLLYWPYIEFPWISFECHPFKCFRISQAIHRRQNHIISPSKLSARQNVHCTERKKGNNWKKKCEDNSWDRYNETTIVGIFNGNKTITTVSTSTNNYDDDDEGDSNQQRNFNCTCAI